MSQYGGFFLNDNIPDNFLSEKIPYEKTWEKVLSHFLSDCYCVSRVNEGIIFHLKNDISIQINIMELEYVIDGDNFVSFSFSNEKNELIIPFDSILYIEFLPYNPKTIKLG